MYVSIFKSPDLYSKVSMSAHGKLHKQDSHSGTLALESMFLCSTVCVCVCLCVCLCVFCLSISEPAIADID